MPEIINMAPTWAVAVEAYMEVIGNHDGSDSAQEAVKAAKEDLRVMARLADKHNEIAKGKSND